MLCDDNERWDREGGRLGDARGKRYGDVCICIADSLSHKEETRKKKHMVPEITIHSTTIAPKYRNITLMASNIKFILTCSQLKKNNTSIKMFKKIKKIKKTVIKN